VNILICNDDGFDAPGIIAMIKSLETKHNLFIAAPQYQQSAKSHGISLHNSIKTTKVSNNFYKIDGTPADCILIAENFLFKDVEIDLVLSGINCGQNLAEDIYYSGTVAAAREATFHRRKAIAISVVDFSVTNFSFAAQFVLDIVENGLVEIIGEGEFLNINIPNIPLDEIKGIVPTSLGHRQFLNFSSGKVDEKGNVHYNIGGEDIKYELKKGTDISAVKENKISITPIFANTTSKVTLMELAKWEYIKYFGKHE